MLPTFAVLDRRLPCTATFDGIIAAARPGHPLRRVIVGRSEVVAGIGRGAIGSPQRCNAVSPPTRRAAGRIAWPLWGGGLTCVGVLVGGRRDGRGERGYV